jgi:hypothetical protein
MPKGYPGSGKGQKLAEQVNATAPAGKTGLEMDPSIIAAMAGDIEDVRELDKAQDAMSEAEAAITAIQNQTAVRRHPIGNGSTVPMPWEGKMNANETTCSVNVPGQNRGCQCGKICMPEMVGKGPFNMIYLNRKTGLVKSAFCTKFISSYMKLPYIQILPGVDFVPTRMAEYAPLPNGQQPVPGPNQPRTRIMYEAVKTKLPCTLPEDVAREVQRKRRNGIYPGA